MKLKPLNKKGFQLVEIPSLVIVLVTIAIVLGLSATVLFNVRQTSGMSTTSTRFYENSTFVALNSTVVDFTPSELAEDGSAKTYLVSASCTSVLLSNTTADITSKFTVSGCTASLSDILLNNTNVKANFTYRHNVYNTNYNITTQGLNAQSDMSGWQATWVVIIAAAVVIGIVGRYLFFRV